VGITPGSLAKLEGSADALLLTGLTSDFPIRSVVCPRESNTRSSAKASSATWFEIAVSAPKRAQLLGVATQLAQISRWSEGTLSNRMRRLSGPCPVRIGAAVQPADLPPTSMSLAFALDRDGLRKMLKESLSGNRKCFCHDREFPKVGSRTGVLI